MKDKLLLEAFNRLDARFDADGVLECRRGKPCNGRCIPQDHHCIGVGGDKRFGIRKGAVAGAKVGAVVGGAQGAYLGSQAGVSAAQSERMRNASTLKKLGTVAGSTLAGGVAGAGMGALGGAAMGAKLGAIVKNKHLGLH